MAAWENLDFSGIGNLGNIYLQEQQSSRSQSILDQIPADADATALGPLAVQLIKAGDPRGASLAQLAEAASRDRRDYALKEREFGLRQQQAQRREEPDDIRKLHAAGIDPKSPEGRKALFPRTDTPISATDKKAIFEAEDEGPAVQGTIETLNEAMGLNDKAMSGWGAGLAAEIGTKMPGIGMVIGSEGQQKAKDTLAWSKAMNPEAIKVMASTLKGATTDFELRKFVDLLSDTSTPPEIRKQVMQRMLTVAERKKQIVDRRVKELRSGDYFKPPGAAQTQSGALPRVASPADAAKLPKGTRFLDPNGVERIVP
jgi:hypothetical protein